MVRITIHNHLYTDAGFEESKHPRARSGEFAKGGGGSTKSSSKSGGSKSASEGGGVYSDKEASKLAKKYNPSPRGKRPSNEDIDQSLYFYKQYGYGMINTYMRGGRLGDKNSQKMAEEMKNNFEHALNDPKYSSEVSKNGEVAFRGLFGPMAAKVSKTLKPGKVFTEKTFLSSSSSNTIARRFAQWGESKRFPKASSHAVVFNISLPKGLRYLKGKASEKEMILPAGLKLRVDKIEDKEIEPAEPDTVYAKGTPTKKVRQVFVSLVE